MKLKFSEDALEAEPALTVKGLAVDDLSDSKPDDYYWIERVPSGGYILYASVIDVPAVLSKKMPEDAKAKDLLENRYVDDKLVRRVLDPKFIDQHFNPNRNVGLRPQVMVMRIHIDASFCFDMSDVDFNVATLDPQGYLSKKEFDSKINAKGSDEISSQLRLWSEVAGRINRKRVAGIPFDIRGVDYMGEDTRFMPMMYKIIGEFKYLMTVYVTKYMQTVNFGANPGIYLHPDGNKSTFMIQTGKEDFVRVRQLRDAVRDKLVCMPMFDVSPFTMPNGVFVPGMQWTKPLRDYVSITNLRRLYKAITNGNVTQHDWIELSHFCGELNAKLLLTIQGVK